MEEKQTKQLNIAISAVFIIVALVLVWMAASRQSKDQADSTGSATTTAPAAVPTAEYDALKSMTQLALATQLESWTPAGKVAADKEVSKRLVVKGNVAQAFLLVDASEGENALTKYDSIFFKLNDAGGHLFRPLSLATPKSERTSVLYDLKDVAVLPSVPYDENRTPDHANLLATLKDGHTVLATGFISSLRQSELHDVSLYYSCVSGSDCSVTLK